MNHLNKYVKLIEWMYSKYSYMYIMDHGRIVSDSGIDSVALSGVSLVNRVSTSNVCNLA